MSDQVQEANDADSPLDVPGRRKGRGRLSTIEMLPDDADEAIAWANQELREGKLPQTVILVGFNDRLVAKGIKPISKGAFSRYSIRMAIEGRKLEASRAITDAVLERMSPADRSDSTLAAIELFKYRVMESVMAQDTPDPDLLNVASLALARLSSTALREAEGQRRDRKDQAELDAQLRREAQAEQAATEAAEAATAIAKEAGLSADRIAAIRKGVLGLSS